MNTFLQLLADGLPGPSASDDEEALFHSAEMLARLQTTQSSNRQASEELLNDEPEPSSES